MYAYYYNEIVRRYRVHCSVLAFWTSSLFALAAFIVAIAVNNYATGYATLRASNSVTDIVLSNIPVFDVDGYFVYGAVLLIAFIVVVLLANPKQIPFTLYSLALFFLIRAIFISLTHVGPFPTHTPIQFTSNVGIFFSKIFFGGDDLFFSAHTGVPFLMALVFWREPVLRYIFLAWSVFFGTIVLLGHIHYSIDVASAYFISFGIYHITMWLFSKEHRLFLSEH
jgi:hypothetical protein